VCTQLRTWNKRNKSWTRCFQLVKHGWNTTANLLRKQTVFNKIQLMLNRITLQLYIQSVSKTKNLSEGLGWLRLNCKGDSLYLVSILSQLKENVITKHHGIYRKGDHFSYFLRSVRKIKYPCFLLKILIKWSQSIL
jgi:hypothetical protein